MTRWWPLAALLFLIAGILPFALLIFHAVPQADDFVYGALVRQDGLWGGLSHIYAHWSGRVFSNALIMLPTAMSDATGIDRVLAGQIFGAVMLSLLAALAYGALRSLARPHGFWPPEIWQTALGSLLFLYVLLSNARSVRDTLLWVPGLATYAVPAIVGASLYVWLHDRAARGQQLPQTSLLWLCPILALTATANEFTGPALIVIIAASYGIRLGLGAAQHQPRLHAAFALATLAGLAVVLAAPGNETRLAEQTAGGDPVETLVWGPIYFLNYLALRVDSPGLIGWLLLVALASRSREPESPGSAPSASPILVWTPLAVFLAIGVLAFSAGVYGFGSLLPGRAQNQVHLIGMVLATLAVAEAMRVYGPALSAWRRRRAPSLDQRRLIALAIILIALSPQTSRAVYTLATGAAAFEAENRARLAALAHSADAAVQLPRWQHRPLLLVQEDLTPNPNHWINRGIADYFGLASVAVRPPDR